VRVVREQSFVLDGIPAQIRYKNIKNLYLRVRDGYIELSVPQRTAQRDMENFVSRRRAWIEERPRAGFCAAGGNRRRARGGGGRYGSGEWNIRLYVCRSYGESPMLSMLMG